MLTKHTRASDPTCGARHEPWAHEWAVIGNSGEEVGRIEAYSADDALLLGWERFGEATSVEQRCE